MIKPNYMLIGAAKCATSSICNLKLTNASELIGASAGRPLLRPPLSRLRAMPGYRLTRSMVSSIWRRSLRDRLFIQEMQGRPRCKPAMRKWVLEQIGEDCRRLLVDRSKPEAMWDPKA